jgi:hypothetical protein
MDFLKAVWADWVPLMSGIGSVILLVLRFQPVVTLQRDRFDATIDWVAV